MTLLQDAETLGAADLLSHQQTAWEHQRRYVAKNSVFYQELWGGRSPPQDLRDLPDLPLSNKALLRISQAASPPFGSYLASARATVTRLHRTSGTTGQGRR
jgi:phenylacetate-CoA ligase